MTRRAIADLRVLITGASSGIGRRLALELARRGARLVLLARRQQRLQGVVEEIARLGADCQVDSGVVNARRKYAALVPAYTGACQIVVGDVTDPAARQAAIDCATSEFGGLDLLVNNAGVGALGPFEQASPERMRQVMEVNFFSLVEMTRQALPLLKRGQRPMIVNIGSILSHRGVPLSSEYCASKFAVRGFSQSLRAELRPLGIDVLLVSPGSTESEFWEHLVEQRGQPAFRGRPASAELVARRIARAIERGDRELFPTWSARLIAWAERLSPSLLEWIVARRM